MDRKEMDRKEIEQLADDRCPSHSGILVNNCKGDQWICKDESSILAVTYSYCVGGCGVFGKVTSNEKITKFLYNVFKDLKNKGINDFEFSCEDDDLTRQILSLFPEKTIHSEVEYSYRYQAQYDVNVSDNNYEIIPINRMLLESASSYENHAMLTTRMENSWEVEAFLKMSLGFVAVKDHRMIGIIFGSARYREYLAVDIEVDKACRRMGIAETLTKHFIKECQEHAYKIQWDCVESNVASQRLAEKTGFELFKKRLYYWFDI